MVTKKASRIIFVSNVKSEAGLAGRGHKRSFCKTDSGTIHWLVTISLLEAKLVLETYALAKVG